MYKISEYKNNPDRLSDFLPWAYVQSKGIVANKNGSFQTTARFRGPDLDSATQFELISVSATVNNAMRRLGSGWCVFTEAKRKYSSKYPDSTFPDPASLLLDTERKEIFLAEGNHFESEFYITFVYRVPPSSVVKAQSRMIERDDDKDRLKTVDVDYRPFLQYFLEETNKLLDILSSILPELELLDNDGTLTYLHSTVSTKNHPVRMPDIPMYLDSILTDQRFSGGLEPRLGDNFIKTLTIRFFPGSSFPGILDQLNRLSIEYRWVTRFICLDKNEALAELAKVKRKWFAKRKGFVTLVKETLMQSESKLEDSDAVNKAQDADVFYQEVAADLVSAGYLTITLTVWDPVLEIAQSKLREVERIINNQGFTCINETINSVEAWLSSIPGQCNANIRFPMLNTMNLAHLIPLSSVWPGQQYNKHLNGPPLLHCMTSGSTPFRLSLHVGDVGHSLILGPTGMGKSVLLWLLAIQFRRYPNSQVFGFDKGASSLATTLGVGGAFYDVGDPDSLSFQPLGLIDKDSERAWAQDWIVELLVNEQVIVTPESKKEIWSALNSLAAMSREHRTITGFTSLLQSKIIRDALAPYTLNGPFGYLLDSTNDTLDYGSWQIFEMGLLFDTPKVIPPVLSYLFHRLESRFTGEPTIIPLDESWTFFDHPIFVAKLADWLITLRKRNVSVIFSTAGMAKVVNNAIFPIIMEQCFTKIFLPNPSAFNPDMKAIYDSFGLNETQVKLIATATPKRQYYYTSHLGNRLFELGLGDIALALVAASSEDEKRLIRNVQQKHPQHFLKYYFEELGLNWAADLVADMVN